MVNAQPCIAIDCPFVDLPVKDAVATAGEVDGIPVFKVKSWRLKGETRPEVRTSIPAVTVR